MYARWLSRRKKSGVSSKRRFETPPRVEAGVRLGVVVVRRAEGVVREASFKMPKEEDLSRWEDWVLAG